MFFFKKGKSKTVAEPTQFRRRATDKPPTEQRMREMYERPSSFTNLLPWMEYCPDHRCFLLDDGYSVGALFEIKAVGTEGRTENFIAELRDKVQNALCSIEEEIDSPWIFQLYIQDEGNLLHVVDELAEYLDPRARNSELSDAYLETLESHLKNISQSGGAFHDTSVTGGPWRGKCRRVRATLYRRRKPADSSRDFYDKSPEDELNNAVAKLASAFIQSGIRLRRVGGKELYEWMFRWFNPRPDIDDGDIDNVIRNFAPYPGDGERPFGYDFAETLMLGMPHSDAPRGIWWFDGIPHKTVTIQGLKKIPGIGLFSAERKIGDYLYAMFDSMPEDTVLAITIVIAAQDEVRNHLSQVQHGAVGDNPEAMLAAQDAKKAMMEIAKGNKLFPVQMALYVRGDDEPNLHHKINQVNSLLSTNGLRSIMERNDLIPLDSYIRNLPMAYRHDHDKREARRSRLIFSKHCANLLPVYGRSTGSGHPGIVHFNRGGEAFMLDPLNPGDRKKNGHALLIGPTGAGKSATLVYMILQMLAVYRPRIFIIEAGNSFGLLGQYLESKGVSTNRIVMAPSADVSLPPFSDALKLLDKRRALNFELDGENDLDDDPFNDYDDDIDDDNRDLLGEMEIAARIMITGGDVREDNRLTRADRLLIRRAIYEAARSVKNAGRDQVLTEDVVHALRHLDGLADRRLERTQDMADSMELFCSGLAGHFFNRPGVRWPDVDFTLVDMGILAREGYEDQLTVAYIGLMNHIHDLVERHQNDARPTIVITDEGHIITTNPLLSPYVIKIVKMWRKLGAWFWIATQSLDDFPDVSKKMLNMLEWWFCLVMPKEEVEHIARFRDLRDEEKNMLLATRKSPKQYTEGVVLTDELSMLFRVVPPPLVLVLAMTEKEEKARRASLMKEHGCSELEAVELIAREIALNRREESKDHEHH